MFVVDLIKKYEGCRLLAYKDSKGFWTIGWGHLLDQKIDWTGYTITQEQADAWLLQDIGTAESIAMGFPFYHTMGEVRQGVLTSMTFQMGSKPRKWPHFNDALSDQDYVRAAQEGLDSEWARNDSPERAKQEMALLERGSVM